MTGLSINGSEVSGLSVAIQVDCPDISCTNKSGKHSFKITL